MAIGDIVKLTIHVLDDLFDANMIAHPELLMIGGTLLFYLLWLVLFALAGKRGRMAHVLVLALLAAPELATWQQAGDDVALDAARDIRLATFNVRGAGIDRGEPNEWLPWRRPRAGVVARELAAAVLGTQEGSDAQLLHVSRDAGYARIPCDDHAHTCDSAILYDERQVQLLEYKAIWLSPTPMRPNSKHELATTVRTATWASFKHKATGQRVDVVNTHLEHVHDMARQAQARVLAEFATKQCKGVAHAFVMGDMNSIRFSGSYRALRELGWSDDAHYEQLQRPSPGLSFHAWRPDQIDVAPVRIALRLISSVASLIWPNGLAVWWPTEFHIDWILGAEGNQGVVKQLQVVRREFEGGLYGSDHHPVVLTYAL